MKKQALVALTLLLLPSAVFAQEGRGRGMGMGPQNVARLALDNRADLAITDAQVPQLEALARKIEQDNDAYLKELQKMREGGTSPRDMTAEQRQKLMDGRQKLQQSNVEVQAQIRTIFSAEQNTKLEELIARSRPPGRRGGGPR